MQVFVLHRFGLKTPICAPKSGVLGHLIPQMVSHINRTPKKDVIGRIDRPNWSIGVSCARRRNQKRKTKTKKPDSGKLGVCPDHPSCLIEIPFCMVGGLLVVVTNFKFHQNWLSGLEDTGVQNCPFPLTWPLAYTTACTTVLCQLTERMKQQQQQQQHRIWSRLTCCVCE